LYERLLPSPAGERGSRLGVGRQGAQDADLSGREEVLCDALAREVGVVELDVDTDLARAAERVQRDRPGVGEVEPGPLAQSRLAKLPILELKVPGSGFEVAGEQTAKQRPANDISRAVALEAKAISALLLVGREHSAHAPDGLRGPLEAGAPD